MSVINPTWEYVEPNKIVLSWFPPFSLNLSYAEPDIVYCVDVYNITVTDESRHLSSDCNILRSNYSFTVTAEEVEDTLEFVITPVSNVNGAKNGSTRQISLSNAIQGVMLQ